MLSRISFVCYSWLGSLSLNLFLCVSTVQLLHRLPKT